MTRSLLAFVAGFTLLLSGAAHAQETFENLSGTWWFRIAGQDKGAMLIQFSEPVAGMFLVQNIDPNTPGERDSFGFSSTLGAFFVVAADQMLTLDSKGNVTGELELTDPETEELLGTLTLEKGKPNNKFNGWKIKGAIAGDAEPVVAKLTGKRLPETFPVLSGRSPEMKVSGKGVKSSAFDVAVVSDTELGFPTYNFAGAGPVSIDKAPDDVMVTMLGRFMLTHKFELYGLVESPDFGDGLASGKLKLPTDSLVPKLNLLATADRKVRVKGTLVEPTDPVLEVTPPSFDFGALGLDAHLDHAFSVDNVGAGTLVGAATFLDGDVDDFSIVDGENTYGPLDPNEPAETIFVRFEPLSRGPKSARILFDVGGGSIGAQVVTVTGVGGVAEIAVDPNSVDFADTNVGVSRFETVTITNNGDGDLEGTVTIAVSPDFSIFAVNSPNPEVDRMIDYDIGPGDTLQFSVRFQPAATGDKTGTLTFTGGGGATVPLTGSTP